MYQTPVDICNRAAQHIGAQHISDFTENSLQAGEFSFVYDKLRRAELRRNVWQFATRRVALRPIAAGSMLLTPVMWSSATTYGWGAIVSDSANILWQSRAQDNLNNAPGNSSAWEAYCGPLVAQPYDTSGTTGYFAGELVYETPGDGTYSVYLSLQSGNSSDPRAPSLWVNSTDATATYAKDQVVLYWAAWAVGTTYAAGNVVSYLGNGYVSLGAGNVGNTPSSSTKWALVSFATSPGYYNALATYPTGSFTTYLGVNYVALQAATGNPPVSSPTFWVPIAAGTFYASLIDFNLNNNPSLSPTLWSAVTAYTVGNTVCASNGLVYTSLGSNSGQDPTLTTGFWSTANVLCPWTAINPFGTADDAWLQLNVTITDLSIQYPIGSGPAAQSATRNVYMLPANFLRRAPQDPKAGSTSFLGAPTGLMYDDWTLEGKFIVTREVYPILLRFVADVTDVTNFDDMFCEGLAARVAMETCERITQSTAKMQGIQASYKTLMTEARTVNGIETGPVEPPEDDYVTCRI